MKKILFFIILWLLMLSHFQVTWGNDQACLIKNWPAQPLDNYLLNLRKVSNNFSTQISQTPPSTTLKDTLSNTKRGIQRNLNTIISWDGYYSLFDFYIIYGSSNEYVGEIWRDYNLLQREQNSLKRYLDRLTQLGRGNLSIDTQAVCTGIENCKFEKNDAIGVLSEIMKNHENIMDYYRLSILGKTKLFKGEILFVPNTFQRDFSKYYNEYTTHNCSMAQDGFLNRAKEQIDLITNWQKAASYGMRDWQDALAMLNGSMDEKEYERREREILANELGRQGLSLNASNAVLNNLDRYNQSGGFTRNNNFITNSFNYLKDSIISQIKPFNESVLQWFNRWEKEVISSQSFAQIETNLQTTKSIEEKIADLFEREIPYAQLQDASSMSLETQMLKLHHDLTQTIQVLDDTIKISRKVCNDQARWLWICE